MKKILIWASLVSMPLLAADPVASLESDRKQIQAQTIEIVGTAMNLDPAIAEAFWAVFRDYEVERVRIGDRRVDLIREFTATAEEMTDEQARVLAERTFAIEADALKLKKKTFEILEQKISPRVAARFIQVMNQVDAVVAANLSREMPLIGGF